jgi:hypothetical protein
MSSFIQPTETKNMLVSQENLTSWVGTSAKDIVAILGAADERCEFEEESIAYLSYLQLGLSILLKDEIVDAVFAYSGRIGGYETINWSRYQGKLPSGVHLDMLPDDVSVLLGRADHSISFSDASIPCLSRAYMMHGLGFQFIAATGEIIYVNVFKPRPTMENDGV